MASKAALNSTLSQIRAERARRLLEVVARDADQIRYQCRTFAGFARLAWPILEPANPLIWNWHLDAICEHLEAITFGRMEPRLLVNVSPGSSKSMLISVLWQAWEWGPCAMASMRFLSTSFELGNVTRDTRKTRDLIMSDWYQALWPEIDLVRSGETSFANSQTGTREGVPFASLTAKRGDRLVIDDPHSLDGAESDTERDKATRRYIEGGQNRLNDQTRSAIVIVMQRLHENDLSGVVLSRDLGFVHLLIPMEYESARSIVTPIGWKDPRTQEGELMDAKRMPRLAVERLKLGNDYGYNGQYQQRPAPREGGMFKADMIEVVASAPAGGIIVRGWDFAGSKRKSSAWTVGLRMRRVGGLIYIEDVRRKRASPNEVEQMVLGATKDDGLAVLQSLPQDPGQAGLAQKMNYAELLAGWNFRVTTEQGEKQDRAIPFAAQVEAGMVKLVRGQWNSAYLDELRNFPAGSFKDQVDASSRAFMEVLRQGDAGDQVSGPIIGDPEAIALA